MFRAIPSIVVVRCIQHCLVIYYHSKFSGIEHLNGVITQLWLPHPAMPMTIN